MTTLTTKTERSRLPQPWWLQAAQLSVSATILNCIILASARYPGEHWPIAAATIVITAFATSFCTDIILLFISHRLRSYRNAVFTKHNLDWGETGSATQRDRSRIMAIRGILLLSYAAATWGAALYTFQWTAQLSNLPLITNTVHSTGLIALIAGASTVTALIIVAFGMVAVVDRLGDPAKPIPPIIHGIYKIAKSTSATSQQPVPSFIFQPSRAA